MDQFFFGKNLPYTGSGVPTPEVVGVGTGGGWGGCKNTCLPTMAVFMRPWSVF